MKNVYVFAIAALTPLLSLAAGYGGAEGRNRLGETIHIASDSYHELYVVKGTKRRDWSKAFDMNVHCPEFKKAMDEGGRATFSCPPERAFPLSGTTYRITTSRKYRPCSGTPYFDNRPGTVYLCVKGCNSKKAPAIFKEGPWEC
jgi:hypothetical protein